MSTGDELFAAIRESPEDDTIRLLYADWLEEHGDPRAEFIRLQIQLAGMAKDDPERVLLEIREGELLRQNFERFRPPRLTGVAWGDFYKGFIDRARFAGTDAFLRTAADAFEATPLRTIVVARDMGAPADSRFDEFTGTFAPLSRLTELDLFGQEHMQGMLTSPCMTGLVRLRGARSHLKDDDIVRLARGPVRPRLRELDLSGNGFGGKGLEALAASRSFPSLERLALQMNRLGGSLGALGEMAVSLEMLDLVATDLDYGTLWRLMPGPAVAKLVELRASSNMISDAGAAVLACSPASATLRELRLSGNQIGPAGAGAMARADWPALEVLDLRRNRLGADGARFLAQASGLPALVELGLAGNALGDDGAQALAAQTGLGLVTDLSLEDNGIGLAGVAALANSDRWNHLRKLSLRNNAIGAEGALALAEGTGLAGLTALSLGREDVGTRAIRAHRDLRDRFGDAWDRSHG